MSARSLDSFPWMKPDVETRVLQSLVSLEGLSSSEALQEALEACTDRELEQMLSFVRWDDRAITERLQRKFEAPITRTLISRGIVTGRRRGV